MSALSDEQLAMLADALDDRERALKSTVHEHVDRLRDDSGEGSIAPAGDLADQAEVRQIRDKESAAVARDVWELRAIEAMRERIARGEAGTCVDCGDDIAFARLQLRSTALRCVRCQTVYERTHALAPEMVPRDV